MPRPIRIELVPTNNRTLNPNGETFLERYGHVQYTRKLRKQGYTTDWKTTCELCNQDITKHDDYRSSNAPVFDHCAMHGWIRGIVCQQCNAYVIRMYNPWSRKSEGKLLDYLLQCRDCRSVYTQYPTLDRPVSIDATRNAHVSFNRYGISRNKNTCDKLADAAIKSLVSGGDGWASLEYSHEGETFSIYVRAYDCGELGYMFSTFYD